MNGLTNTAPRNRSVDGINHNARQNMEWMDLLHYYTNTAPRNRSVDGITPIKIINGSTKLRPSGIGILDRRKFEIWKILQKFENH